MLHHYAALFLLPNQKAETVATHLDFKCRGDQKNNPEYTCGVRLGGPALDSLLLHDFKSSPLVDVRHCPKCGWVRITIRGLDVPPLMEVLGKQVRIDFIKPEDVFKFVEIRK